MYKHRNNHFNQQRTKGKLATTEQDKTIKQERIKARKPVIVPFSYPDSPPNVGGLGSKIRARHIWVDEAYLINQGWMAIHPIMNLPDYHWTNKGSPPGGSYLLGPVRSKGQYGQGMSAPTNNQTGNIGQQIHSNHQMKPFISRYQAPYFGDLKTI